jgi:hypothetical protein
MGNKQLLNYSDVQDNLSGNNNLFRSFQNYKNLTERLGDREAGIAGYNSLQQQNDV